MNDPIARWAGSHPSLTRWHNHPKPLLLSDSEKRGRFSFDVVNIGSTGTFVVLKPVDAPNLCAEITSQVPFEVEIMVCNGRDIRRLVSDNPFAGYAAERDIVSFVGVMTTRKLLSITFPLKLPAENDWYVKVFGCQGQFVLGLYRRQMKTITYLSQLEKLIGVSLAIRNWNTILAVEKALRR
jgi:uncharacterized protein (DUF1697 family)